MHMLPSQSQSQSHINLLHGASYANPHSSGYCNFYTQTTFGLMNRFQGYNNNNNPDYTSTASIDETASDDAGRQRDKGWLRLGLGGSDDVDGGDDNNKNLNLNLKSVGFCGLTTELDLLPGGNSNSKLQIENDYSLGILPNFSVAVAATNNFPTSSLILAAPPLPLPLPEVNWSFRPISHNINSSSSSSSCSSFVPFGSYLSSRPPLQLQTRFDSVAACSPSGGGGPSCDLITIIDPPRRPQSGIWFTLQPLENQGKQQPVLPQRFSSYLRIKDGKMTVRLLIKYLIKKLRLDSESEIEISCRGEKVEGCLTMQHIRDKIWCSSSSSSKDSTQHHLTLLPNSSTIHHLMVLHYAIITSSSSN